jgi:hypothetical protein
MSFLGSSRKFSFLSTDPLLEINEWTEKKNKKGSFILFRLDPIHSLQLNVHNLFQTFYFERKEI